MESEQVMDAAGTSTASRERVLDAAGYTTASRERVLDDAGYSTASSERVLIVAAPTKGSLEAQLQQLEMQTVEQVTRDVITDPAVKDISQNLKEKAEAILNWTDTIKFVQAGAGWNVLFLGVTEDDLLASSPELLNPIEKKRLKNVVEARIAEMRDSIYISLGLNDTENSWFLSEMYGEAQEHSVELHATRHRLQDACRARLESCAKKLQQLAEYKLNAVSEYQTRLNELEHKAKGLKKIISDRLEYMENFGMMKGETRSQTMVAFWMLMEAKQKEIAAGEEEAKRLQQLLMRYTMAARNPEYQQMLKEFLKVQQLCRAHKRTLELVE